MHLGSLLITVVLSVGVSAASEPPSPTPPKAGHKPEAHSKQHEQRAAGDQRGTENSPVFIKVIPSLPVEPDPAKESDNRHDYASSEWWLVYITAALVAATCGLIIYTARLWSATKALAEDAKQTAERQAREMQESLLIAGRSADAALKTAQHMQAAERAYVKMSHFRPGLTFKQNGQTCQVIIQVKIRNFGRTPATVTDVLLNIKRLPANEALPVTPSYEIRPNHQPIRAFLVAEDEFVKMDRHGWVNIPFPGWTMTNIEDLKGQVQLLVYGYVDYIDQFGCRHRSGYAMRYEPDLDDLTTYERDGEAFDRRDNLIFMTQYGWNYDRPRQQNEGSDWQNPKQPN